MRDQSLISDGDMYQYCLADILLPQQQAMICYQKQSQGTFQEEVKILNYLCSRGRFMECSLILTKSVVVVGFLISTRFFNLQKLPAWWPSFQTKAKIITIIMNVINGIKQLYLLGYICLNLNVRRESLNCCEIFSVKFNFRRTIQHDILGVFVSVSARLLR